MFGFEAADWLFLAGGVVLTQQSSFSREQISLALPVLHFLPLLPSRLEAIRNRYSEAALPDPRRSMPGN